MSSQVFDVDTYNRSQSASKSKAGVYGQGNGRGRPRGKRDHINNCTFMQLRSIIEDDYSTTTTTQISKDNKGDAAAPNLKLGLQHESSNDSESIDSSSDVVSSSNDDDEYDGDTKTSPI